MEYGWYWSLEVLQMQLQLVTLIITFVTVLPCCQLRINCMDPFSVKWVTSLC